MADQSDPNAGALGEPDRPGERFRQTADLHHVAPQVFAGLLEAAVLHAKAAPQDASAEPWTPIGPRNVGGAVRSLVQDPTTPTTLYAGTAQGGVWKTVDDGYTWTPLGGPDLILPAGALALAPSDRRVLYVGTGEPAYGTVAGRGLYRSQDAGQTFEKLVGPASTGAPGAADHYARIQVDPHDARRCWAASDTGLWRLEPGGAFVPEGPFPNALVTDVVLTLDPRDQNKYVLLAGVAGTGIFRGVFDRQHPGTVWTPVVGAPTAGIARIRLAFSQIQIGVAPLPFAYAIMEDQGVMGLAATGFPTFVYQSTDFGVNWPARPLATAIVPAGSAQAFYSLVIAVDPSNANRVLVGDVDLYASGDGGLTWTTVMDWTRYDIDDRSQHGDHHTIHFDVRGARRLWSCNDGGISYSPDYLTPLPAPAPPVPPPATPLPRWRKRSYGIVGAQFNDITTHPTFPFMCGGGMQDNGTFLSYGGATWYRLNGADGGQMAFDPTNPRRFITTWQGSAPAATGVELTTIIPPVLPPPLNTIRLPDIDPPNNVMVPQTAQLAFAAGSNPTFYGVVEADPVVANRLLVARHPVPPPATPPGFFSTNAVTTAGLNLPGATGDGSAAAFVQGAPDLWMGTTTGMVFTTAATPPAPPAVGPAWTRCAVPAVLAGTPVAGIAVHPLNPNVVAVSTMGSPGQVILTHDKGAHWQVITGAAQGLPPGPIPSVAFDPTNTQVLFAGTLAGVYVVRNLPARAAGAGVVPAVNPAWTTYSLGLPLIQVNDVAVTPLTNTLRCATFGRGVFESNIRGVTPAAFQIPGVLLSVREHVADDGRTYVAPNVFFTDPRVPAPGGAPPADFNRTRAFDIRVDAPTFARSEAFDFGESMDGVEFDETFVCDRPLAGDTNFVYVQVRNRGSGVANNVRVFLYFASAATPLVAPPLDPLMNFPGTPDAASVWQLVAPPETIGALAAGEPAVVRFEWVPPLTDWIAPQGPLQNVALLAVCTNDQDAVAALPGGTAAVAFVRAERRAALRVIGVNRDSVYIRDGIDDDGTRGSVAWGGRSPDIIVVQAAVANANSLAGPFKDLAAQRTTDRVKPGANIIYVRVFNRTRVPITASVQVYVLPLNHPVPGTGWATVLGPVAVPAIPARGWRFAQVAWPGVTDPDPAVATYKAFTLVALAQVVDGAGTPLDPFPQPSTVTDIDSFWKFFITAPLANNAAMRSLRFSAT